MNGPVLVTGASGLVGAAVARRLRDLGVCVVGTFRAHPERVPPGVESERLLLSGPGEIRRVFERVSPCAVIHCAAVSELRSCEEDPATSRRANVGATDELARLCRQARARLLFCSTDQVFDGSRPWWKEEDRARPIHEYGRQKREAELRVLRLAPGAATVVRLALVVGPSPSGTRSGSESVAAALSAGRRLRLFVDEYRTPIHVGDVARLFSALLERRDAAVVHAGGPRRLSRYDLGLTVARVLGLDSGPVERASLRDVVADPPRPPDLSLDTSRLRSWFRPPVREVAAALEEDRAGSGV